MASANERRADRRLKIIDAAVEVLADKGFHQARISDIAQRAGVADGTIYLYFQNKEDLLISIFEEKMELLLTNLHRALEGVKRPQARIARFAQFHFEQVQSNPAVAAVLQVELRLSNKFLKEYRPKKLWEYLEVFAQIVSNGQEEGVFRKDIDPFTAMWSFFGALDELAMQWVLTKPSRRFSLPASAEQVAAIFTGGLRHQPQENTVEVP